MAPRVLEELARWELSKLTSPGTRRALVDVIGRNGHAELTTQGIGRRRIVLRVVGTVQPRGGLRLWWECASCRGHRSVLYGDPQGLALPICRRCVGLPYRSQREAGALAWELVGKHARIAERCYQRRTKHQDGSPRRAKRSKRQTELRDRERAARRLAIIGLEQLRPDSLTRAPQRTRCYAIAERAVRAMVRTISNGTQAPR